MKPKSNHDKAVDYFKSTGEWFEGCVLHHKDTNMKVNDPVRYAQWNPEDLQVLSRAEHAKLHLEVRIANNDPIMEQWLDAAHNWHKGKHAWNYGKTGCYSEETLRKMSEAGKKREFSEETRQKMSDANRKRKHSAETKDKIRAARKKYWANKKAGELNA